VITDTDKNEFTIPTGWIAESLGNLADKITKGATPTTYGYAFQRLGVNFIKVQNISNGYIDLCSITDFISEDAHQNQGKSILKVNDVLFSIAGTIGETAIVKSHHLPANTNQALAIISGFSKILIPKYLEFQLRSFVSQKTKDKARGGAMNNVSLDDLKSLKLLLPPYSEQQRIVAKIETLFSELDKGIESFKTAREQLKIYRQSLLKHAFSGKLTEQWRAENPDKLENAQALLQRIETERQQRYQQQLKNWEANDKQGSKPKALKTLPPLTTEELAELPEGWGWVKIDKYCDVAPNSIKAGPFGSALKKEFYVQDGYKVYGQEQVISGDWNCGDYFVDEAKYQELESCKVKPFDILISLVGTVGKVLVLPDSILLGIINPRLIKITPDLKVIVPEFFKYYFESSFLKGLYKLETHGATMDVLNLGIIQSLPFPICSIDEQKILIQELEVLCSVTDQLDQTITTALQQAEALRQSILKKAFSGQLVPQDPSDEPASVLLERIRVEKAQADIQPVRRRGKTS
jgi:type I restriction enzyme S subunit